MIADAAVTRLELLLPLLACPACRGTLSKGGHHLVCDGCAARYPFHAGRPVLLPVAGDGPPRIMPAEHISNQPPRALHDWMTWFDGWILNIGAGGTLVKLENCVEMEYSIFRHSDVVADAHALPFADASFDAVVTFNTFEHLREPRQAASEVRRVLKPGGRLVMQTAFLQPVHESPFHFYHATEYGLRHWFRDFDIKDVTVPEHLQPANVIAWLAAELLREVEAAYGPEAGRALASSTLEFWRSSWDDDAQREHPYWDLLGRLSQDVQKRYAAGFQLDACKPVGPEAC